MTTYITVDDTGRVTASADWQFPGSEPCPCEVIRYPNGQLYRADTLPPVYANPGTAEQQISGDCPPGWVMMPGPCPEALRGASGVLTATWEARENGEWVPVPTITFETMKTAKRSEINAAADRAIGTLTVTYPDREISTFDKQESEARAYAADPTASTPLLSALAQARGISLPELVERVLAKADAFAVASGSIIGQRQALEDRLDACTTLEEVQGITVNISMPDGGEA